MPGHENRPDQRVASKPIFVLKKENPSSLLFFLSKTKWFLAPFFSFFYSCPLH